MFYRTTVGVRAVLVACSAVALGATWLLSSVPPGTASAEAQTAGNLDSCVRRALAPPRWINDRFKGKSDKVVIRVAVPEVGADCDGVVARNVAFGMGAKRFVGKRRGWVGASAFHFVDITNRAQVVSKRIFAKRHCKFSPVQNQGDRFTHGFDNKYKVKRRVTVQYKVTVLATGDEIIGKVFRSKRKKMCMKR